MKFHLKTSGGFYTHKRAEALEELGFSFGACDFPDLRTNEERVYKIGNPPDGIEINSLEDLMKLVQEYGDVIVSEDTIEIYDNYRE